MGEFLSVVVLPVVFALALGLILRRNQRRVWNDGYCRCGGMWRYFDTDSGGAHGAKCDRCRNSYWFDWYQGEEIDPMRLLK